MATSTITYTDRTATITITSEQFPLDFTSKYFHIDILDVLHSYFNLDVKNSAIISNDGILNADKTVLRITNKNVNDYVGTSSNHLIQKGIQIWADTEYVLKIRMHDLMSNGVGFTTNEVTVDIPNPKNPVEVERVHTTVLLFPKLIQSDIHLYNESDASLDIQLKDYERRPDFQWSDTDAYEDMMYVNTSAGTTNIGSVTKDNVINNMTELDHQHTPLYCIETSALLPTSLYFSDPHGTDFGVGLDFDNVSSCLINTLTNVKTQDIPYEIEEMDNYSYASPEAIECKRWHITQFISNDKQGEVNINQVFLGLGLSGMYYNEPPAEKETDNAILHEDVTTIGLENNKGHLKYK